MTGEWGKGMQTVMTSLTLKQLKAGGYDILATDIRELDNEEDRCDQIMDAQTKHMLCVVYDALSEKNQAKFKRMLKTPCGILKLVEFGWKQVK